jgi:hypothetical protein
MRLSAFQELEGRKNKKDTHKERLKDQTGENGEGFFSTVVAFLVQAVDRFKPSWRFGEKIADSCQVVGQN